MKGLCSSHVSLDVAEAQRAKSPALGDTVCFQVGLGTESELSLVLHLFPLYQDPPVPLDLEERTGISKCHPVSRISGLAPGGAEPAAVTEWRH